MIEAFLVSVICALIVERFFYAKDMNKQVSDCMKALISRNMNDFVQAVAVDKNTPSKNISVDEVSLSEATDEQFLKAIKEGIE